MLLPKILEKIDELEVDGYGYITINDYEITKLETFENTPKTNIVLVKNFIQKFVTLHIKRYFLQQKKTM